MDLPADGHSCKELHNAWPERIFYADKTPADVVIEEFDASSKASKPTGRAFPINQQRKTSSCVFLSVHWICICCSAGCKPVDSPIRRGYGCTIRPLYRLPIVLDARQEGNLIREISFDQDASGPSMARKPLLTCQCLPRVSPAFKGKESGKDVKSPMLLKGSKSGIKRGLEDASQCFTIRSMNRLREKRPQCSSSPELEDILATVSLKLNKTISVFGGHPDECLTRSL